MARKSVVDSGIPLMCILDRLARFLESSNLDCRIIFSSLRLSISVGKFAVFYSISSTFISSAEVLSQFPNLPGGACSNMI